MSYPEIILQACRRDLARPNSFESKVGWCLVIQIRASWKQWCIALRNDKGSLDEMACLLEISFTLLRAKHREFWQSVTMLTGGEGDRGGSPTVYSNRDDPDSLLWVEEWADRSILERYLETDAFKTLMGALRTLAVVQDCRIVDLGFEQRSDQIPGYRPRQLEGRRISDGPEDRG